MSPFIAARSVLVLLSCWLLLRVLFGLEALIEYQMIDAPQGILPSLETRRTLVLMTHFIGLCLLLYAVHFASSQANLSAARPTLPVTIGLILLVPLALAGVYASFRCHEKIVGAIASHLPTQRLVAWTQQTIEVGLIHVTSDALTLVLVFLFSLWKWWAKAPRASVNQDSANA